jgi:hypothetical protein
MATMLVVHGAVSSPAPAHPVVVVCTRPGPTSVFDNAIRVNDALFKTAARPRKGAIRPIAVSTRFTDPTSFVGFAMDNVGEKDDIVVVGVAGTFSTPALAHDLDKLHPGDWICIDARQTQSSRVGDHTDQFRLPHYYLCTDVAANYAPLRFLRRETHTSMRVTITKCVPPQIKSVLPTRGPIRPSLGVRPMKRKPVRVVSPIPISKQRVTRQALDAGRLQVKKLNTTLKYYLRLHNAVITTDKTISDAMKNIAGRAMSRIDKAISQYAIATQNSSESVQTQTRIEASAILATQNTSLLNLIQQITGFIYAEARKLHGVMRTRVDTANDQYNALKNEIRATNTALLLKMETSVKPHVDEIQGYAELIDIELDSIGGGAKHKIPTDAEFDRGITRMRKLLKDADTPVATLKTNLIAIQRENKQNKQPVLPPESGHSPGNVEGAPTPLPMDQIDVVGGGPSKPKTDKESNEKLADIKKRWELEKQQWDQDIKSIEAQYNELQPLFQLILTQKIDNSFAVGQPQAGERLFDAVDNVQDQNGLFLGYLRASTYEEAITNITKASSLEQCTDLVVVAERRSTQGTEDLNEFKNFLNKPWKDLINEYIEANIQEIAIDIPTGLGTPPPITLVPKLAELRQCQTDLRTIDPVTVDALNRYITTRNELSRLNEKYELAKFKTKRAELNTQHERIKHNYTSLFKWSTSPEFAWPRPSERSDNMQQLMTAYKKTTEAMGRLNTTIDETLIDYTNDALGQFDIIVDRVLQEMAANITNSPREDEASYKPWDSGRSFWDVPRLSANFEEHIFEHGSTPNIKLRCKEIWDALVKHDTNTSVHQTILDINFQYRESTAPISASLKKRIVGACADWGAAYMNHKWGHTERFGAARAKAFFEYFATEIQYAFNTIDVYLGIVNTYTSDLLHRSKADHPLVYGYYQGAVSLAANARPVIDEFDKLKHRLASATVAKDPTDTLLTRYTALSTTDGLVACRVAKQTVLDAAKIMDDHVEVWDEFYRYTHQFERRPDSHSYKDEKHVAELVKNRETGDYTATNLFKKAIMVPKPNDADLDPIDREGATPPSVEGGGAIKVVMSPTAIGIDAFATKLATKLVAEVVNKAKEQHVPGKSKKTKKASKAKPKATKPMVQASAEGGVTNVFVDLIGPMTELEAYTKTITQFLMPLATNKIALGLKVTMNNEQAFRAAIKAAYEVLKKTQSRQLTVNQLKEKYKSPKKTDTNKFITSVNDIYTLDFLTAMHNAHTALEWENQTGVIDCRTVQSKVFPGKEGSSDHLHLNAADHLEFVDDDGKETVTVRSAPSQIMMQSKGFIPGARIQLNPGKHVYHIAFYDELSAELGLFPPWTNENREEELELSLAENWNSDEKPTAATVRMGIAIRNHEYWEHTNGLWVGNADKFDTYKNVYLKTLLAAE